MKNIFKPRVSFLFFLFSHPSGICSLLNGIDKSTLILEDVVEVLAAVFVGVLTGVFVGVLAVVFVGVLVEDLAGVLAGVLTGLLTIDPEGVLGTRLLGDFGDQSTELAWAFLFGVPTTT